jgi:hypothetical protein
MVKKTFGILCLGLLAMACAPDRVGGQEKANAYHAQEAEREEANKNKAPRTEAEKTLQFPMCEERRPAKFPANTEGATFRAVLFMRITGDGKTAEHCYTAVEGDIKWEEKALGDFKSWKYDTEHAGQPRERVISYRVQ